MSFLKNTVPIIVQKVAKHSYWVESILTGLRKSAEKSFYELDFIAGADSAVNAKESEHSSVIVIGYLADWLCQTLDRLLEKGYEPIVVNAGVSDEMLEKCSGVFFRLGESIESTIEYLKSAGRKNIWLFGTNNTSIANRIKEDVFLKVTGSENEPPHEFVINEKKPLNDHVEDFLNCIEEQEIDAIICQNDTLAIHLMNRMLTEGFKIPDDIYIVGMGNSLLGQKMAIPLSSIEFDYEELGVQAFSLWRYLQRSGKRVHVEVAIPCRFIPRASTGSFIQLETSRTRFFTSIPFDLNTEINGDEFYDDVDVQKVLKFEAFLRSCDKIDNYVLEGIVQGYSDARMADMYNISDRAIRYRINKMTKKLDVQARDEIVSIIKDLRMFSDYIDKSDV